jgi:hypothetical protein
LDRTRFEKLKYLGIVVTAVLAIAANAVLVTDHLPELGSHLVATLAGCPT